MHIAVLYVYLQVQQCGEAKLFPVDTVNFLQLADGAPSARPGPLRHDRFVLLGHELRHEAVDTGPDHLVLRDAEHLLHVTRCSSDDPHGLGVD